MNFMCFEIKLIFQRTNHGAMLFRSWVSMIAMIHSEMFNEIRIINMTPSDVIGNWFILQLKIS